MSDDDVPILDLAAELGVLKPTIFKWVKKLEISPGQRRIESRGNQLVSVVSALDANRIREKAASSRSDRRTKTGLPDGLGFFYLIQVEPEADPGRFKAGFTRSLEERLRKHRCSASLSQVLKSWPCKRTWEKAAIDSVTQGCEHVRSEVFRASTLEAVISRADRFFAMMPTLHIADR